MIHRNIINSYLIKMVNVKSSSIKMEKIKSNGSQEPPPLGPYLILFYSLPNMARPVNDNITKVFGGWNGVSFGVCMMMGYLSIFLLKIFSRRIVHQIYLHNNLKLLDIVFFNAYWKPEKIMCHISQFQQVRPSYMGFTQVELTSMGKIWLNLQKNQYKNIRDYEQIIDSICLGKTIESQFKSKKEKKDKN